VGDFSKVNFARIALLKKKGNKSVTKQFPSEGTLKTVAKWMPDFFAMLWPYLKPHTTEICSEDWVGSNCKEGEKIKSILEKDNYGGVPDSIISYLSLPDKCPAKLRPCEVNGFVRRAFVVAQCIDNVMSDVHPRTFPASPPISVLLPEGLQKLLAHYRKEGSYGKNKRWGLVFPKPPIFKIPIRNENKSGDNLKDKFESLCCHKNRYEVDDEAFEVQYKMLPERRGFGSQIFEDLSSSDLRIAVVPLAEDADDVILNPIYPRGEPRIKAEIKDDIVKKLCQRAKEVIYLLEENEVNIAVFPEIVVTPKVSRAISEAMKNLTENDPKDHLSLKLVVAGSGLTKRKNQVLPYNECVVYGEGGVELWRQCKCNHYSISVKRMNEYGMRPKKAGIAHKEDFHSAKELVVAGGVLGRMMVLICEDLFQPIPKNNAITHFQPEWVFSPVLSGNTEREGREHRCAKPLSECSNITTIVANSLVLPLKAIALKGKGSRNFGVGIAVVGGESHKYFNFSVNNSSKTKTPLFSHTAFQPKNWKSVIK